jgi:hypothetical protein
MTKPTTNLDDIRDKMINTTPKTQPISIKNHPFII